MSSYLPINLRPHACHIMESPPPTPRSRRTNLCHVKPSLSQRVTLTTAQCDSMLMAALQHHRSTPSRKHYIWPLVAWTSAVTHHIALSVISKLPPHRTSCQTPLFYLCPAAPACQLLPSLLYLHILPATTLTPLPPHPSCYYPHSSTSTSFLLLPSLLYLHILPATNLPLSFCFPPQPAAQADLLPACWKLCRLGVRGRVMPLLLIWLSGEANRQHSTAPR